MIIKKAYSSRFAMLYVKMTKSGVRAHFRWSQKPDLESEGLTYPTPKPWILLICRKERYHCFNQVLAAQNKNC